MRKWEYLVVDNAINNAKGKQAQLNKVGEEGWELVCLDDYWYIFKRPVDVYEIRINKEEWQAVTGPVPEYAA